LPSFYRDADRLGKDDTQQLSLPRSLLPRRNLEEDPIAERKKLSLAGAR
jgi:hypothetical protein